jgi:hypothetical protein
MSTEIATFKTMQAEHRDWLAAHARWRSDIEHWQAEHKTAVERLTTMQGVIAEHGNALEAHAQTMRTFEAAIAAHNRDMAAYEAGKGAPAQDVLANRHQDNAGRFNRQLDAHERIKKHHQDVMAQLRSLELSAEAAM